MKVYALGLLLGFAGVLLGLSGAGTTLALLAPERMPAPAITRLVQLDEKLRFIRERPALDPTILAVGSSITWRQLDGRAIDRVAGGKHRFFNGGTGYLQIHQTRDLTLFYLDQFENTRVVLLMIGLPDFRDCSNEPADMLNHADAARYAFGQWPEPYFYFRYVSPQRYLRTAMTRADQLTPYEGEHFLDSYGSSPIQLPEGRMPGLRYGDIGNDPACVRELSDFVNELTGRGLQVVMVSPPVHPAYREQFPGEMAWLRRALQTFEAGVQDRDRFSLHVLTAEPGYDGADFFDAFHLQWHAVQALSRRVAALLEADRTQALRAPAPAPHARDPEPADEARRLLRAR